MPVTAYSIAAARELDLVQWLTLNGYSTQEDPLLARIPPALRERAAADIECSGCRARGATLVRVSRSNGTGRAVGQGHFRFTTAQGANPHAPLCEFYDEGAQQGAEYLADFASDRSALTRTVRDLVCRGIRANLYSQSDMRQMRLWFLQERTAHAFTLDVTEEVLQWCVDMWATRVWSPDQIPFRPEHGQIPAFDWEGAASREWARRNERLFKAVQHRVHFTKANIARPLLLIAKHAGQAVLDPTALRDKYAAVVELAGFAVRYVFGIANMRIPSALNGHVSDWGAKGHALLALSALLLFKSDWDIGPASAMFSTLTRLPHAAEGLEGNLIGLNPFHDYPAWQVINAARQIAALRTDSRPVGAQIESLRAEMQASHHSWATGIPDLSALRGGA